MKSRDAVPVACTLQAGDYQKRLAWIAELARDGLLEVSRKDLRLELTYAASVADRVREMVRMERHCCAFLDFELSETAQGVRLAITVPDHVRELADGLFEQFVPASGLSARRPLRRSPRPPACSGPGSSRA